jgi:hypothetical protein
MGWPARAGHSSFFAFTPALVVADDALRFAGPARGSIAHDPVQVRLAAGKLSELTRLLIVVERIRRGITPSRWRTVR